jgi:hypothetical protein
MNVTICIGDVNVNHVYFNTTTDILVGLSYKRLKFTSEFGARHHLMSQHISGIGGRCLCFVKSFQAQKFYWEIRFTLNG